MTEQNETPETETAEVVVEEFAAAHPSDKVKLRLAGGNAGVMAATNEVVEAAQFPIVVWVFGAVIALCLVTFRSVRATLCSRKSRSAFTRKKKFAR